jgi:hypothetical protein
MNERVIYAIALVDHLWKPSTLFLNISGASGTEIKSKIERKTTMNIGYIRISHTDSLDGTSLETQEKRIKAYSELHNFRLDKVYSEICSGSVDFKKRPVFSKLLNELKKGSILITVGGGHSINKSSRNTEIVEIKLGPYDGKDTIYY